MKQTEQHIDGDHNRTGSPGLNHPLQMIRALNESCLLTAKQAAAYMTCSERTMWEWKKDGSVACIQHGSWVRFDRRDLDEAKARFRIPARVEVPRKRRIQRVFQDGRNA